MEACAQRFTVLPESFDNEVFPLGDDPSDLKNCPDDNNRQNDWNDCAKAKNVLIPSLIKLLVR